MTHDYSIITSNGAVGYLLNGASHRGHSPTLGPRSPHPRQVLGHRKADLSTALLEWKEGGESGEGEREKEEWRERGQTGEKERKREGEKKPFLVSTVFFFYKYK